MNRVRRRFETNETVDSACEQELRSTVDSPCFRVDHLGGSSSSDATSVLFDHREDAKFFVNEIFQPVSARSMSRPIFYITGRMDEPLDVKDGPENDV